MKWSNAAAVLCVLALSAGPASWAQTVYVPPGTEGPRFGGEFALSEVGPVAGYWGAECRNWRVRSQARRSGPVATGPVDDAFKRFVSGLIAEKPNYDDFTPAMAEALRKNLQTYWPSFNRMGRATAAKQFDTDKDGNRLFVVDQAGGRTHWNVTVDREGKIASAFLCEGTGL
ncbi:MAG: hypothetical protein WDN45_18510 [Caulobacteraceae bacterium]